MSRLVQARQLVTELGGVLPRSVGVLRSSDDWNALSPRGARQLGEVALDELVVTGMTLMSPVPRLRRPVSDYVPIAEQLTALGVRGAHTEPEPLRVKTLRRRRVGNRSYEHLTFDHDPDLPTPLAEQNVGGPATAAVNLCRHDDDIPRPWLVWVHGAGQGGLSDLFVSGVRRFHHKLGYNIAMPIQPGHGPRRGHWPPYPDTEPIINVAGMIRAVSEVRAVIRWIEPQATVIALSGLSLGSAVAALVAGMEHDVDAVALYTPILGLNTMIGNHLHRWGSAAQDVGEAMRSAAVADLTSVIDPLALEPIPPVERRLIVGAWHDQMSFRQSALAVHERWGGTLHWHDGSHVGHLFSQAVVGESERFLRQVAAQADVP